MHNLLSLEGWTAFPLLATSDTLSPMQFIRPFRREIVFAADTRNRLSDLVHGAHMKQEAAFDLVGFVAHRAEELQQDRERR